MRKRDASLIAIVGGSGAGKTWLAEALAKRLGTVVGRLSLDDFYLDRSHLSLARRARLNFDRPAAIDWATVERVLTACKRGRRCALPKYDFKRHARLQPGGRIWTPKRIVLVEGLWLLRRRAIRKLFAGSIFVDCPEDIRLDRRIRRDTVERGRKESAVRIQFQEQVKPMHQVHVSPQRQRADQVVQSPVSAQTVRALARWIRERTVESESMA